MLFGALMGGQLSPWTGDWLLIRPNGDQKGDRIECF